MSAPVEAVIFELLGRVAPGGSISPEEVARAVDPEAWRRQLSHVRDTAIHLARQERLVITRHGKPADPDRLKGVWRMRAAEARPKEDFA